MGKGSMCVCGWVSVCGCSGVCVLVCVQRCVQCGGSCACMCARYGVHMRRGSAALWFCSPVQPGEWGPVYPKLPARTATPQAPAPTPQRPARPITPAAPCVLRVLQRRLLAAAKAWQRGRVHCEARVRQRPQVEAPLVAKRAKAVHEHERGRAGARARRLDDAKVCGSSRRGAGGKGRTARATHMCVCVCWEQGVGSGMGCWPGCNVTKARGCWAVAPACRQASVPPDSQQPCRNKGWCVWLYAARVLGAGCVCITWR